MSSWKNSNHSPRAPTAARFNCATTMSSWKTETLMAQDQAAGVVRNER